MAITLTSLRAASRVCACLISATNQFALNLVELGVVKTPDATSRLGYNITLGFGDAMNIVNASDPSFMQYLKEAYLIVLAPIGKGLQIDFGKFVTPAGAEVIESNANLNYSRSLLFNYAIPFYHFGGAREVHLQR